MTITIVENSWIAKIAAWKLHAGHVAIVIASSIHLHNVTKEEFLRNRKWLKHEVAHVYQWKKFGRLRFPFLYLLESFNKGYYYNKYEVEARSRENDLNILHEIEIL